MMYSCRKCNRKFQSNSGRYKHEKAGCNGIPKTRNARFFCQNCNLGFQWKCGLKRHKETKNCYAEGEEADDQTMEQRKRCGVRNCGAFFATTEEICDHLKSVHNLPAIIRSYHFVSEADFLQWKQIQCEKSGCKFVKSSSDKIMKDGARRSYYSCNRSGEYSPKKEPKTGRKAPPTIKVGFQCSAFIYVRKSPTAGNIFARACLFHYGHDNRDWKSYGPKVRRNGIQQQEEEEEEEESISVTDDYDMEESQAATVMIEQEQDHHENLDSLPVHTFHPQQQQQQGSVSVNFWQTRSTKHPVTPREKFRFGRKKKKKPPVDGNKGIPERLQALAEAVSKISDVRLLSLMMDKVTEMEAIVRLGMIPSFQDELSLEIHAPRGSSFGTRARYQWKSPQPTYPPGDRVFFADKQPASTVKIY